jgi:hypothetical protein
MNIYGPVHAQGSGPGPDHGHGNPEKLGPTGESGQGKKGSQIGKWKPKNSVLKINEVQKPGKSSPAHSLSTSS